MSFAPLQRPKPTDQELDRGRGGATQARRYWPGKAPDWVPPNTAEEASDDEEQAVERTSVAAPVIVRAKDDPRLARLADKGDTGDRGARRREVAAPRVVSRRQREESSDEASSDEGSDKESEDEDAVEARRAAVREKLKQNKRPEEEVLAQQEDVSDEEEDETEYETDSEDEGYGLQVLKPQFIRKAERDTIAEREQRYQEELAEQAREVDRLASRKAETKEILIERIALDEAQARAALAEPRHDEGDINTDDDETEDGQDFEAWKKRELARIARYKEDQQRDSQEAAEKAKLASMTDEERRRWELANPKESQIQPKEKWKFLQKYWHKGAFFQETSDNPYSRDQVDDVYTRDYSAPTGEDKLDKSVLPKVMQVKNFGRRGRTKHTHLVDQDTTVFDDALAPEKGLQDAYFQRRAGVSQTFSKPKTLPINEKRHTSAKDKNSRAAYLSANY